jgi:hypothetical protein
MTTTRRYRSTRATACLALSLLAAGTAGCGDDGGEDDATAAAEPSTTIASSPAAPAVTITATDYRFDDLPAELEAGSALALRNQSSGEIHELVAMRVADGEDRAAVELVSLPSSDLAALFAGPPAVVIVAPPGEDGFTALGAGTLDEPGRYLVMCFIPIGGDPDDYLEALAANPGQPPSVPGGPPHFTTGMYGEIIVR